MKARKIFFLSDVVSLEHEVPALLPPQIKDRSKFLTEYINLVLCDDDGRNPIEVESREVNLNFQWIGLLTLDDLVCLDQGSLSRPFLLEPGCRV
jgi:hypothetical protein